MIRGGVFAVSRKLFDPDDSFFGAQPFTRREAWQWLIAEASFKPRTVRIRIARREVMLALDRGQLSHSRAFMAEAWKWSEKAVRTFIDHLEIDERIVRSGGRQTGQHQSIITICKYKEYQFACQDENEQEGQQRASKVEKTGRETGQQTGQQTDDVSTDELKTISDDPEIETDKRANKKGQQSTKKGPELEEGLVNKRKNMRSRAGEPSGFEKWYEAYPKKKARKAAERAYAKVVCSGEIAESNLLDRTRAFAASWAQAPADRRQFIPYPASWLNDGSYADEPDEAAAPTPAPVDPRTFSNERWHRCLEHHDRTGEWVWGPRPGAPDCLVPPALLQQRSRSPPDPPPNFEAAR